MGLGHGHPPWGELLDLVQHQLLVLLDGDHGAHPPRLDHLGLGVDDLIAGDVDRHGRTPFETRGLRRAKRGLDIAIGGTALITEHRLRSLDRPAGHHGGHQEARAGRATVDEDRARTADPVLAPHVGAGQAQVVPEGVRQEPSGGELELVAGVVVGVVAGGFVVFGGLVLPAAVEATSPWARR